MTDDHFKQPNLQAASSKTDFAARFFASEAERDAHPQYQTYVQSLEFARQRLEDARAHYNR